MSSLSPRPGLLVALIVAALPLGASMAFASDSGNSGSGGATGTTKTETTKTEPVKPPEDKDDQNDAGTSAPAPAPGETAKPEGDAVDGGQPEPQDDHAAATPPGPELGHSVGVDAHGGTVKVKTPGGTWHGVGADGTVPVGSVVDATHGRVTLRTAVDATGATQTGTFWGARFQVRQVADGMTELVLRDPRPRCPRPGAATASRAQHGLWGHDKHGRFRTRGRNSVATVRGTTWFVGERCGGTYTRVTSGAVRVYDRQTRRVVVLHAGQSHLARTGS